MVLAVWNEGWRYFDHRHRLAAEESLVCCQRKASAGAELPSQCETRRGFSADLPLPRMPLAFEFRDPNQADPAISRCWFPNSRAQSANSAPLSRFESLEAR